MPRGNSCAAGALLATRRGALNRWAWHRAVRAKDAAITGSGAQERFATLAFVEKLASVGGHRFALAVTASGTCQYRFQYHEAHGWTPVPRFEFWCVRKLRCERSTALGSGRRGKYAMQKRAHSAYVFSAATVDRRTLPQKSSAAARESSASTCLGIRKRTLNIIPAAFDCGERSWPKQAEKTTAACRLLKTVLDKLYAKRIAKVRRTGLGQRRSSAKHAPTTRKRGAKHHGRARRPPRSSSSEFQVVKVLFARTAK